MKIDFRLRLLIWYLQRRYAIRQGLHGLKWLLKGKAARARRRAGQEKALEELARMSQESGLYDE